VGPGSGRLWNLLKNVKIRDVKGIARSWPQYYCRTSQGDVTKPTCRGEMHGCALASLVFNRFQDLYSPKSATPIKFPLTTFHMDSKFVNIDENRKRFAGNIISHMQDAVENKRHLMWLVEVLPNHAFILEQGSPRPNDFRLYQSVMYGFDVNYWLSESAEDIPCYINNWGNFKEFKYTKEQDIKKAMDQDLETLKLAKNTYGSHQTFDDKTFEEIFTKLSWGWKLLEGSRLDILQLMEKWETSALDITGQNRKKWSLKHIFGLEPIELQHLENSDSRYFGITVQAIDLGTSEDLDHIVMNQDVLNSMDNSKWDDFPVVPSRTQGKKEDTSSSLNPFVADPESIQST